MQGRIGDSDASDEHRLESRHGCHCTGASDLYIDAEQFSHFLFCRELMGHGPTRCARDKTHLALRLDAVDLVHYAIDIIGKRFPLILHLSVVVETTLGACDGSRFRVHTHAPGLQLLQNAAVIPVQGWSFVLTDTIAIEFQRSCRGNSRIKLAQAAGGGVARIGEGLFILFALRFVQLVKAALGHKDLATNFQYRGKIPANQLQRNTVNRTHVQRYILAAIAVTAR